MFKKIAILIQVEPVLITQDLYVLNTLINNVSPPDANGIITFYSGDKKLQYLGTLAEFKTDLGL